MASARGHRMQGTEHDIAFSLALGCAMQWHSPTLEKTLCHAPFLAYGVLGRSPYHPAPSSEHTVPFLRSFVYKTAAKPNPKKKRSVIYPSLHGVLERSQCHAAAAEGAKLSRMHAAL